MYFLSIGSSTKHAAFKLCAGSPYNGMYSGNITSNITISLFFILLVLANNLITSIRADLSGSALPHI